MTYLAVSHPKTPVSQQAKGYALQALHLQRAGYTIAPVSETNQLYDKNRKLTKRWTPDELCRAYQWMASKGMRPALAIYAGSLSNGRYLAMLDLDTHQAGQDAECARAWLEHRQPDVVELMRWHRSKRNGWHGLFVTMCQLPSGRIFDDSGAHIGEMIASDQHRIVVSAELAEELAVQPLMTLTRTQAERLRLVLAIGGNSITGADHWKERAQVGRGYLAGVAVPRITQAALRHFLREYAGKVGAQLDRLFDQRGTFDRSAAASQLMQNVLLHVHKITQVRNPAELAALAMGYWLAADAFGKTDGYQLDTDGYALLAAVLAGDTYAGGTKRWRSPFWHNGALPVAVPASVSEEQHGSGRPAGNKDKQIAKLRRILARWQFDCDDRIYYRVDDLAELLGVKRRAVQNYLATLEANGQIVRGGALGRGASAWLELTGLFWNDQQKGARNCQNAGGKRVHAPVDAQRTSTPESGNEKDAIRSQELCTLPASELPAGSTSDQPALGSDTDASATAAQAPAGAQHSCDLASAPDVPKPSEVEHALAHHSAAQTSNPSLVRSVETQTGDRITLRHAVRLAFERTLVDRVTGEIRRATSQRILAELTQLVPAAGWNELAIERAIAAERQQRQRAQLDKHLAELAERARSMKRSSLARQSATAARRLERAEHENDTRAWLYRKRAGILAAEEQRREAELAPGQADLWKACDQRRLDQHQAEHTASRTPRAVRLDDTQQAGSGAAQYDARGLVARLRQLQGTNRSLDARDQVGSSGIEYAHERAQPSTEFS